MALQRLTVSNLRNLRQVNIEPQPRLNLIYGENGSGKTSLLEAINMLGLGRSFRSNRFKPIINYDAESLTLFTELGGLEAHRIGVEKNRQGETTIRMDGRNVLSAAELAEHLPVLTLNASSFDLITGPPTPRRQLLDWLAFHVEPDFFRAWRDLQVCLKQRNSLLRHGRIRDSELRPWERQLVVLAEKIDELRQSSFTSYLEALRSLEPALPTPGELRLEYRRGWKAGESYQDILEAGREQDLQRGFTQSGPHRADIRIIVNGENAADVLSRGQQKVLVAALVVGQGRVFNQLSSSPLVYLVDDLPAELDLGHSRLLARWLRDVDAQIFVTAVERQALLTMWGEDAQSAAVFHVEHGTIVPEGADNTGV